MTMSQGSQTIQRLCRLAGVSRASYYRFWQKSASRAQDTAIGDAIQRVALANGRRRGYRYITHQLRRDGIVVNHKRVLRLMRQDNLLRLRRKPFVPQTTDARHDWEIVPNLVRGLRLGGLDQLPPHEPVGNPYDNAKAESIAAVPETVAEGRRPMHARTSI
jgi:transposase InsO family protein